MSSMTALLIIAFGIISVWSEPIRVDFLERRTDGQAVIECLAQGFVKVKGDMEGATMDGQDQRVEEACKFFKETERCILNKIDSSPPPAPQFLYLSAAFEYQHLFIAHQGDMCRDILYEDLKRKAQDSGALALLNPVENKQYDPCVRDVLRHCLSEMVKSFGEQNNEVNPHFQYLECYESKSVSMPCKPPMLQAFLDNGVILKAKWEDVRGDY